jgi:hypothetical protein
LEDKFIEATKVREAQEGKDNMGMNEDVMMDERGFGM